MRFTWRTWLVIGGAAAVIATVVAALLIQRADRREELRRLEREVADLAEGITELRVPMAQDYAALSKLAASLEGKIRVVKEVAEKTEDPGAKNDLTLLRNILMAEETGLRSLLTRLDHLDHILRLARDTSVPALEAVQPVVSRAAGARPGEPVTSEEAKSTRSFLEIVKEATDKAIEQLEGYEEAVRRMISEKERRLASLKKLRARLEAAKAPTRIVEVVATSVGGVGLQLSYAERLLKHHAQAEAKVRRIEEIHTIDAEVLAGY